MDLLRVYARAKGRVQDVGYRGFCEMMAKGLNITGYARNLPDGSVEVVAEGRENDVNRFLQRIGDFKIDWSDGRSEKGVEELRIDKKENPPEREYKSFSRK